MSSPLRSPSLDEDAAAFLAEFGAAFAFPVGIDDQTTDFLRRERAGHATSPGRAALTESEMRVEVADHTLAGGLRVRSYVPDGPASERRPVLLYMHGGGFVSGSVELTDSVCRIFAQSADCIVISVDYRLAPEHPYPAALDDGRTALKWARECAADLFAADATRIGVMGSSAGGALAAGLAQRVRDDREPPLGVQVLVYPVLDARMATRSYAPEVNGHGYFVSREQMAWYWGAYRGDQIDADADPYFSPAAALSLASLPPAIVLTAGYDLLRDEAIDYHDRLVESGVPSRHLHYPGQIHGFVSLLERIVEAPVAVRNLGVHAGRALRTGTV